MDSGTRYQKVMEGAAAWGSYYRHNVDKFVEDYLHIKLKLFQRILLTMMFWSTTFVYIASRGQGKSFLSAIYCVVRCILYPGTKVCIASGTRGQAVNVLEKINLELKPKSEELRAEIDEKESKITGSDAKIVFKNTSVIKVVTASDSARGNRCNVLLLDEYRLISKDTITTVLNKFLTLRRMPEYSELTDEERKIEYSKEKNLTLWLSSAFFKDHWSYMKCEDTLNAMLDDNRKQFVCGFPYQLSIAEGLLDPDAVADEMSESDFSEIKWSMEMDAMWYGTEEGAFFNYESISKNRKIRYPMLPDNLSNKVQGQALRIQPKGAGVVRILSADIALMSSRRHNNDATAIFVNEMIKTKSGRYTSNIVYTESCEGLRTEAQALVIRKLYDEFDCDYIVLDCQGIGLGVYDCLARDIVDAETGEVYSALSCYNNAEMASRCTVPGADRVIWSIKANAQFNSDCAFLLREAFRSGRIRLLCTEYDADEYLAEIRGYASLNPSEQIMIKLPYINTTLLVDELTKLQHEESNGKIRVYEKTGMRKDRYSSLSYNYYVATQIENKLNKRFRNDESAESSFIIKPPLNSKGKVVSSSVKKGYAKWY